MTKINFSWTTSGMRHDPQRVVGKKCKLVLSISLETRSSKHLTRKLPVAVKMEMKTLFLVLKCITKESDVNCFD